MEDLVNHAAIENHAAVGTTFDLFPAHVVTVLHHHLQVPDGPVETPGADVDRTSAGMMGIPLGERHGFDTLSEGAVWALFNSNWGCSGLVM
jgi:hypothetical protein